MSAADEVQININDLMVAFSQENAAAVQRAIIAEQKVKAYVAVIERQGSEIELLRAQVTAQGEALALSPPVVTEPEPAVAAVKRAARKRTA